MRNKTVLDNGIRVISEEISHVRSVSLGVWVRCGSRGENEAINGVAHFIEHMLFKGTESRTAFDIASEIDSVGGIMNAFTGKELTSFYIKIPDYHLPMAIDLLADILKNSLFDPEEIEKEKSVVLQEISLVEDTPDDYIHDFFEETFWNGHSLGLPVLGTRKTVAGFETDALVKFFTERYRGGNLVLTAAGNLKHDVFVDLVRNAFESLEGEPIKEDSAKPVVTSRGAVVEKDLEQEHVIIGTIAPSSTSLLRYPAMLMNVVLGGSMSSRLFQEIREKRGLAYSIRSYLAPYRDVGMLGIYVGTGEDKVREVINLIFEEMNRVKRDFLTEKELHSAKELIKGNLLLSMESTDNRMTRLARNEILFERDVPLEEVVANIEAVSREDIRNLAGDIFSSDTISLAAMGRVSEEDITKALVRP
ncbi:MAG: insulinase family protein [Proteobacteria bacterium]|nr:insulinase family protein [Pseudomonadota bacterium]